MWTSVVCPEGVSEGASKQINAHAILPCHFDYSWLAPLVSPMSRHTEAVVQIFSIPMNEIKQRSSTRPTWIWVLYTAII